jgi:acyl-coenzyme A thioesterase PaaI-like protein
MSAASATPEAPAFQDLLPGNHCYGCGPGNAQGLRLKSRWSGEREARSVFRPQPHHCAASPEVVNGGVIATLIDCHAVCTAMADAYRQAGRGVGEGKPIDYVTGGLEVRYRRPTPMDAIVTVEARVVAATARKTVLECTLSAGGEVCATGRVVAVRVN